MFFEKVGKIGHVLKSQYFRDFIYFHICLNQIFPGPAEFFFIDCMDYGIACLFPEYPAQVAGIHADSARDIRHGQVFPVMIVDTAQTGADKGFLPLGSALHGLCGILQQAFHQQAVFLQIDTAIDLMGDPSGPALSAAFIRLPLHQQLPAPFLKGHPGIPDGGSGTAVFLLPLKQPVKQRNGIFGVPLFPSAADIL